MRISSMVICAGKIVSLGLFSACADQSSNINQLNQNEFALRGMIASDRQQMDSLRAELRRTQDELAEMKHGSAANAGGTASGDVNDRLAKLESEVNALQVALPAPMPSPLAAGVPPGTPAAATSTISPPAPATGAAAASPPAAGATAPGAAAAAAEPAPTWPRDLDKD